MTRYLVLRLLQVIPVLFGITVIVFLLIHLVPGDPARSALGPLATPASVAALRAHYGLDKSLPGQYLQFLSDLVHGNLGQSVFYQQSVTSLIGSRLVVSAWLISVAVFFSLLIAVPLGITAAVHEDRPADHAVRGFSLLALGLPSVWVGLMLALIFGVTLGVLPVGGFGSGVFGHIRSLVLPGMTIALTVSPLLIRSIRASVLDIVTSDFIVAARARGLSKRTIVLRHVLPNALTPTITILSLQIAYLLGGTIVVENVFSLPGIGQLLVASISAHDFPVVQGVTLVLALAVLLLGIATDLVSATLDPRIRLAR